MPRNISIAIVPGSETVQVVVGEFQKGEKYPKVIGYGETPSAGMRRGYVTDTGQLAKSIERARVEAEKASALPIKRALLAASGTSLRGDASAGMAMVSKADGEVTALDVRKVLEDCEENLKIGNRKIVHIFPQTFRLDGKDVEGRLEGMHGTKLEAKALFVTYSSQHLEDILDAVSMAGVESIDVVAAPIAAATLALSEKEKMVGVALVDIGAETTTLAVYENGTLISLRTFGIGSEDITNDIALGFKIPLETARRLKMGDIMPEYPKKKIDEVISARLEDIFESIENHLKKIKRSGLLPAGVIFVGGGANLSGLSEFSRSALRLPSRVASVDIFANAKTKLRDPAWISALGLLSYSPEALYESEGSFSGLFKDLSNLFKSGFKQLLP
ncbi:MAG: cell division protein FtsA [Patescibacteria group bacterium]